jgi:CheY-like chemotaxis protein
MHPLSGRRVLLVEDEAVIALDLAALLTELGANVVGPAHSVAAALELLNGDKLDCAVLDINLDGEPVYPVARALAARHIPFAFVTAYYGEKVDREFQDRPVLQKPVDFQELVRALLHTCGHRDEVLGPSEEVTERMRRPKQLLT